MASSKLSKLPWHARLEDMLVLVLGQCDQPTVVFVLYHEIEVLHPTGGRPLV